MYNQTAWDIANELEAFYAQPVPSAEGVPVQFNMSSWGNRTDCGTAACLAGSIAAMRLPHLYTAFAFNQEIDGAIPRIPQLVDQLLGLTDKESDDLFCPSDVSSLSRITLDEAIKTLRVFAQTGKIDWSHSAMYDGEEDGE